MKQLVCALMVATALTVATRAEAGPITGGIAFTGAANPLGGSTWATATGIDFGAVTVASSTLPTGSYLGTQGTSVVFTDFTFSPFPQAGVNPLWSFTFGGTLFTFDLSSLTSVTQTGTGASASLTLVGTGILKRNGTDDTFSLFTLTAPSAGGGTFSFSASNTAIPTPEPGSLIMLGMGLLGIAAIIRRRPSGARR